LRCAAARRLGTAKSGVPAKTILIKRSTYPEAEKK
jgi:hypothetical protein